MVRCVQVGKAWLYLSKAYQNYGAGADADQAKEKSEAALFRWRLALILQVLSATPSCAVSEMIPLNMDALWCHCFSSLPAVRNSENENDSDPCHQAIDSLYSVQVIPMHAGLFIALHSIL